MKTGVSIQELARRIDANRELKHDLIANTRKTALSVHADGKAALAVDGHGEFPILPIAHGQIAQRAEYPSRVYDRDLSDPATRTDFARVITARLHKTTEPRMLRTLGGDLRAFLSNRYQRIENEEIAAVALPILADIPDVKIVSCELTERRMYIQAVTPRVQGEVKIGDAVQAGVVISNSEVGLGSVSVQPLVYRLVCLNGMIAGDGMRANHIGRRIDDNEALWADDTRKADDRAVLLKVRDMVRHAVDAAQFGQRVDKMRALTDRRVTGDPAKAVEVLAKKIGASEFERGGILRSLIEGGDLSAWGVLNAVTHQAHVAASYDRSIEFEQAGGALLNLAQTEWREILNAA